MRNDTIAKIIRWSNKGDHTDRLFTRQLTGNVAKGIAWPRLPTGDVDRCGYNFFFIYDDSHMCIAAVLDMDQFDLHAYVTPAFRRRGIMSRALRDVILPHLAYEGRSIQNVTFKSQAGKYLAQAVGFTINTEGTGGSINLAGLKTDSSAGHSPIPLSKNRFPMITRRIRHAEQLLQMVHQEIACAYTLESDIVAELENVIEQLKDFRQCDMREQPT